MSEAKVRELERKLKFYRERVSALGGELLEIGVATCCEGCQEIYLKEELQDSELCDGCAEKAENKLEFKRNCL